MREKSKDNKSINTNIVSMRIMRHTRINNLTLMNYVHNIIVIMKMGMVMMKNDDDGYNEHQDDGG